VSREAATAAVPTPELRGDEAHVWLLSVAACRGALPALFDVLSADERSRAERFAIDAPRVQYIVGRAALRCLLAAYLRRSASLLRFAYGEHGKPTLAGADPLKFNVSHSDDLVAIGVALDCDLGIDIERCREEVDWEQIAGQCFDPEELEHLLAIESSRRRRLFFEYWTAKESLTKALGAGLHVPLEQIHVAPTGADVVEMTWRNAQGEERWHAYRLDAGSDYAAALAARARTLQILQFALRY
jgi:4'-phosphopantetheinyl transferase